MKKQGYKDRRHEKRGMEHYLHEKDREDNDHMEHKGHVFMAHHMGSHTHGTHHIKLEHEHRLYESQEDMGKHRR